MSKTNSNPSGWVSSTLSKHIDLLTGFAFKSSEYKEQGIRLLRGDNVMQNNIRWDDAKFWDENSYEELSRYQLKEHDIVIALDRTWVKAGLKVSVIRKRDIPSLLVQRVARLRAKSTLNQSFLSYIVRSHRFEQMAKFSKTETAVPHISPSDIRNFKIELPPLLEQRNIAKILELWDNSIEKTEALITAKEKQFEWLTQSLISKKCPDWNHYLARDLFTGVSSKGYPDEELLSVTQDLGVVPRSMLSGRVMSPAGSTAGYKLVEKGNFVISLRSFQGGLEYSDYRGIVSPAYTVLSPKKKIHSGFYRHFFKSYIFIEKYLSVAVIGIRDGKQISSTDFDTIKIPYPDMEEQVKIASQLDTARQEIDLLKGLLGKYRSQKRGLMQKLLTGEWQVTSSQVGAEGELQDRTKENVA